MNQRPEIDGTTEVYLGSKHAGTFGHPNSAIAWLKEHGGQARAEVRVYGKHLGGIILDRDNTHLLGMPGNQIDARHHTFAINVAALDCRVEGFYIIPPSAAREG